MNSYDFHSVAKNSPSIQFTPFYDTLKTRVKNIYEINPGSARSNHDTIVLRPIIEENCNNYCNCPGHCKYFSIRNIEFVIYIEHGWFCDYLVVTSFVSSIYARSMQRFYRIKYRFLCWNVDIDTTITKILRFVYFIQEKVLYEAHRLHYKYDPHAPVVIPGRRRASDAALDIT